MLAEAYQSPLFQSFNGSVMLQPFLGPLTIDYLELFGNAVGVQPGKTNAVLGEAELE